MVNASFCQKKKNYPYELLLNAIQVCWNPLTNSHTNSQVMTRSHTTFFVFDRTTTFVCVFFFKHFSLFSTFLVSLNCSFNADSITKKKKLSLLFSSKTAKGGDCTKCKILKNSLTLYVVFRSRDIHTDEQKH